MCAEDSITKLLSYKAKKKFWGTAKGLQKIKKKITNE